MDKLYKQLEAWVIKWKLNNKLDEFFIARIRLTFYYSITAVIILGISSFALYGTILSNFSESIIEDRRFNPEIAQIIIDRAREILFNRFVTIDLIIIIFIIILGFFVTQKTLKPIKSNMEKQKRFIADASHELRTPIAVIISGLEVNLNNTKLDFSGSKKVLLDTLNEMRDFSMLTNTLLDLSRYETQKQFDYKPIAINELIQSIITKSKNLAKLKAININTNLKSKAVVLGNEVDLGRVFYNILDNAVKYTEPNGVIDITDKITSGKYMVTISDNGIGISKDVLGKVFDPFFRADISRNTTGAGLGLTLSKKIIEDHKGNMSIKSDLNKGTSVTISLNIAS